MRRTPRGRLPLPAPSGPAAYHAGHAIRTDVGAHGESESRQSFDYPLRGNPQLGIAANALPPSTLLMFMKHIVDDHTIGSVLEKASQNPVLVAADENESIISLQDL